MKVINLRKIENKVSGWKLDEESKIILMFIGIVSSIYVLYEIACGCLG
jgi:hypothetical protein